MTVHAKRYQRSAKLISGYRHSRVSKLKNERMRINSNAMFFGRASLGMKKATTSVAVATFFFTDFRMYNN